MIDDATRVAGTDNTRIHPAKVCEKADPNLQQGEGHILGRSVQTRGHRRKHTR